VDLEVCIYLLQGSVDTNGLETQFFVGLPYAILKEKKMEILYIVLAMIVVGLIVGYIAGLIWKDDRKGDYLVAVIAAVITGLLDWYVIPFIVESETLKWIGVALEPPLVALGVLWLIRYAKRNQ